MYWNKSVLNVLKKRPDIPVSRISTLELRGLMVLIAENVYDVCIRYRLLGQMWQPNFMRVIRVTENGMVLQDEVNNKMISVPNLEMIVQFELDGSVHSFQPNFHYDVIPNQD
jgi:hypothetical protein